MNRCKLGIWLLAALLLVGALTAFLVDRDLEPITRDLEQASQLALAGQWSQALASARRAEALWQRRWTRIAALSSHTPMETADQWFGRLRVYAQAEDALRYSDACAQLAGLMRTIAEAQSPNLRNLL